MIDANFIVNTVDLQGDEQELFFQGEDVEFIDKETNMIDILVSLGFFKSKNQAKKNWNKDIEIPIGFSEFIVGKLKNKITILNVRESQ